MNRIHELSKTTYEINRIYCESLGDFSNPKWSEINWELQYLYMRNVVMAMKQDFTPKEAHDFWVTVRINEGWIYGEKKDIVNRTHPCLVEWEDLPKEQQVKDFLFVGVLKMFMEE